MRTIRLLLLAVLILAVPAASFAQFGVAITIAPPVLPVYSQPMVPAEGYLWTPGYWAYGGEGYFWVPGTWVMAPNLDCSGHPDIGAGAATPSPGMKATGVPRSASTAGSTTASATVVSVIKAGIGTTEPFYYNRSVNNVNITNIHNVYNKTVINNTTMNHVSYNGGRGGINARPRAAEETAAHEQHRPPTEMQTQHVHAASSNHALFASVNHGRPAIAATAKPAEFSGRGTVAAKKAGVTYEAIGNRATGNKATPTRTNANRAAANKAAATRTNGNRPAAQRAAQPAPRPATAARPQAVPRHQSAPRPAAAPPRAQNVPRAETTAHAQAAPRPAKKQPNPRSALGGNQIARPLGQFV